MSEPDRTEPPAEATEDDGTPRVRVIGPSLPYADDAEARIRAVIEGASDRSASSDELERAIDDWASRYHLAAARGGLLVPFRLGPEQRILEVGAGCGAITRHLAETGARVVALEGTHARAEVAAARCHDLDNVEVLSGPLSALEDAEGFDVVVVIGVLEYAGDASGGGDGARAFLARLQSLLRDDGCLILAIENQLGLRYLLGYPEDHLATPWVGLAGYPGSRGVRTYSRRRLGERLSDAGFVRQRWFFPFPDYKLPRLLLTDAAYEVPDRVDFVDQLTRSPAPRDERDAAPVAEERAVHRTWLRAGLGRDVANAFVVCASGHGGDPGRLTTNNALAWILSQGRARPWRRLKRIRQTPGGRVVESDPLAANGDDAATAPAPWLRHRPATGGSATPYIVGTTLEQGVLDACRRGDAEAVTAVLARWNAILAAHETTEEPPDAAHPLLPDPRAPRLPGRMADIDLANFVVATDGAAHYIDDEWQAAGGVDSRRARLRALWHLAVDVVGGCVHHPWPDRTTPAAVLDALATAAGLPLAEHELDALLDAEATLVAAVTGSNAAAYRSQLDTVAAWRGPQNPLEAQLEGVLEGQARATQAYEAEIARRGDALAALNEKVTSLEQALAAAQEERDGHRQRADGAQAELRVIRQSRFWRLWQRIGAIRRTLEM